MTLYAIVRRLVGSRHRQRAKTNAHSLRPAPNAALADAAAELTHSQGLFAAIEVPPVRAGLDALFRAETLAWVAPADDWSGRGSLAT